MAITELEFHELRLTIAPATFGFQDTTVLLSQPMPWIGQSRAQAAAHFGLTTHHPGYNLFALGNVGCGRSSLLKQAMHRVAEDYPVPPDLCYFHNFKAPGYPRALRLPAGQGSLLQMTMDEVSSTLLDTILPMSRRQGPNENKFFLQELAPLISRLQTTIKQNLSALPPYATIIVGTFLEDASQHLLHQLQRLPQIDADDVSYLLDRLRINLVVNNGRSNGAPVIFENNPTVASLFGSIVPRREKGIMVTDSSSIRAGSLIKAHGGFLLLHVRDILNDSLVWEQLHHFLRTGWLHLETASREMSNHLNTVMPEPIHANVKLVLIGSRKQYYDLKQNDPEFMRYFRVKVDFAESFIADATTRHASAVFVAHTCSRYNLPHFTAAAVARLLEISHREINDQRRQSARYGNTEAIIVESGLYCQERGGEKVTEEDIDGAMRAREQRHNDPEEQMRRAITSGETVIDVQGTRVGQVNFLNIIETGDCRFGAPVRVTARTYPGEVGLISIEREIAMSGPVRDKGGFILHHYLSSLLACNTPPAFNAAIVFEQEYLSFEGDTASCAELIALISDLAGVPIEQGIAVTGALNQHGDILPVRGINEKIEGYFRVCRDVGLTGQQGVLISSRNQHNLMLDRSVIEAVRQGQFHIYTATQASDALELLTGLPAGKTDMNGCYPPDTLLSRVQQTLIRYFQACNMRSLQQCALEPCQKA